MSNPVHSPRCFNNHMTAWACEPGYLQMSLAMIRAGIIKPKAASESAPARNTEKPYAVDSNGIALLSIQGVMAKFLGKFNECSTTQVRYAARLAMMDPNVYGVLITVDSPGGAVAGTAELYSDIRLLASRKTVYTYIEDLCASAGFWAVCGSLKLFANATAQVGSIGVFTILEDSSKQAEMEGITVHVVATGKHKGTGESGTPISQDTIDDTQNRIDGLFTHFENAVSTGRKLRITNEITSGRVWLAADAVRLGLIDGISNLDSVYSDLVSIVEKKKALLEKTKKAAQGY